jgi:hypothetical protein
MLNRKKLVIFPIVVKSDFCWNKSHVWGGRGGDGDVENLVHVFLSDANSFSATENSQKAE